MWNLVWHITGDPAYDFFFSMTANPALAFFAVTLLFSLFRGRI